MRKIFLAVSLFLVFLFVSSSPAGAKVLVQQKGNLSVTKGEVINDDLFIGAESVDMNGTVNGDVFIGSGTVNINGIVNGNLIIGGGNVTVQGTVKNDVIIGGGNLTFQSAKIGGSLIAGAGTLQIDDKSSVGGSLIAGAGTLNNKAAIGRNAMIGAGSVNLDSKILGEVRVGAGELTLGSNTFVGKDFTYLIDNGKKELVLPPGATIAGQVKKMEGVSTSSANLNTAKANFDKFSRSAGAGLKLISFLGALVIGLVWIKLFGKMAAGLGEAAGKSFGTNFGVGLLILVVTLPVCFILMITIIGFPLAVILLTLFGLALYFTKLVVALAIGNWLSGKLGWNKVSVYTSFMLGLVIFYLVRMIPILGFFAGFVVTCVGLGIMALQFKSGIKN